MSDFRVAAAGVALAVAIAIGNTSAAEPGTLSKDDVGCDDSLLVERRTNLPKSLPWPVDFFQPQVAVPGGDGAAIPIAPPENSPIDEKERAALAEYAERTRSTALLVYADGALQYEWYGEGTGADTISHTYHMQYTPLVLLIGIAIEEGHIDSVDQPASDFITAWRDDERASITIRNLLQMNAGLDLRFDAHYSEGMFSRDACAYWSSHTEDVLVRYPATHAPGAQFDYNYIVPELLGIVLERATGVPYERYLSEKLWQPLGNKTAYLWLNREGGEAHQDAGLFSAPTDWLRLGLLLLDDGRFDGEQIVPASWIDEMREPSATNPNFGYIWLGSPFNPARRLATNPRVGYTVRSAAPFVAADTFYVDGYGGQRVYVSPSHGIVVVRLGAPLRDWAWDNARLMNLVTTFVDH